MNAAQATVSSGLSAMGALLNNGTLVLYSGAMPATPETGITTQHPLITFQFSSPAFGAPAFSGGQMQAQASFVNNSVTPSASGIATWARSFASSGVAVCDYSVGTSGTDITMSSTTITAGSAETITGLVHAMPAS